MTPPDDDDNDDAVESPPQAANKLKRALPVCLPRRGLLKVKPEEVDIAVSSLGTSSESAKSPACPTSLAGSRDLALEFAEPDPSPVTCIDVDWPRMRALSGTLDGNLLLWDLQARPPAGRSGETESSASTEGLEERDSFGSDSKDHCTSIDRWNSGRRVGGESAASVKVMCVNWHCKLATIIGRELLFLDFRKGLRRCSGRFGEVEGLSL